MVMGTCTILKKVVNPCLVSLIAVSSEAIQLGVKTSLEKINSYNLLILGLLCKVKLKGNVTDEILHKINNTTEAIERETRSLNEKYKILSDINVSLSKELDAKQATINKLKLNINETSPGDPSNIQTE